MREHPLLAADGTRLLGWQTESAGPPVLLCPGLGTIPEAWPALLLPSSGVRVLSWYHRGTMGSDRPADPTRITLADHVSDALAVLDAAGSSGAWSWAGRSGSWWPRSWPAPTRTGCRGCCSRLACPATCSAASSGCSASPPRCASV
ncbi:alpha/beta fold hydrolase [Actinokineospora soli]|uniref:Alpha/beta fold hydrolase n=1 Tax=Actinokineospora soli TaxID=1048753 RepID=A0ABW2TT66_9PSEU